MRSSLFLLAGGFMLLLGCDDEPCDAYVDYVCDCRADDPGFDCAEISTSLESADPSLQDQCSIDLRTLEDEDQANGEECVTTP